MTDTGALHDNRFTITEGNTVPFTHIPPTTDTGRTFVCFNALTGDRGMWVQTIGDAVQAAGHGLLLWNFRGQPETQFTFSETSDRDIVDDAVALIRTEKPVRPIYVGLSIGGLFAIRAHETSHGAKADAIVLLNTLRRPGPRLDWINRAVVRAMLVGGPNLMKDLYSPLLMNEGWQGDNAEAFLKADTPYTPLAEGDGTLMLLRAGVGTNWDVAYEDIKIPVLSITGLQDRVFRDPNDIDALYARLPNAERIDMPNAGHMLPVEQPQALSKALLDFASKL